MQTQYLISPEAPQVPPYDAEQMAQGLAEQLALFLFPLLVTLDQSVGQTAGAHVSPDDPGDHRLSGSRRRLALERIGRLPAEPGQGTSRNQTLKSPVAFLQMDSQGRGG